MRRNARRKSCTTWRTPATVRWMARPSAVCPSGSSMSHAEWSAKRAGRRRSEMVIVMEKHTAEGNIERVMSELIKRGFDVHRSTGSDQTVLGVVGQVDTIDTREVELFHGVQEVVRVRETYKLSSAPV